MIGGGKYRCWLRANCDSIYIELPLSQIFGVRNSSKLLAIFELALLSTVWKETDACNINKWLDKWSNSNLWVLMRFAKLSN